MNRRRFLIAAPAAAAAQAPLAAAADSIPAAQEPPVAALFREWVGIAMEYDAFLGTKPDLADDDPRMLANMDRQAAIHRRMIAAPKHNLTDIALTVAALSDFGIFELGQKDFETLHREVKALMEDRA